MKPARRPAIRSLCLVVLGIFAASCVDESPTVPSADSLPGPSAAQSPQTANFIPGRLLVGLNGGVNANSVAAGIAGVTVERSLGSNIWIFQVPQRAELAVAQALARSSGVRFAEPDYIRTFPLAACDFCTLTGGGFMGYKWDLYNTGQIVNANDSVLATTGRVGADMDWKVAFDSLGANYPDSVVVAILDSGIRGDHVEFTGRIKGGYNFFSGNSNFTDDNGHGTHVAGIIGARAGDGTGMAGQAWGPGTRFLAIKVCGQTFLGYGCTDSAIKQGIDWAVAQGAKTFNLSLAGPTGSSTVRTALQNAVAANRLPVCAAGNDSTASVGYPAAFPECVAVSATDWSDNLASYSNWGSPIDLSAPGGDIENSKGYSYILASYYSNPTSYAFMAGTSMAAPQVTGLAALIYSQGITQASAVLDLMKSTADDLGTAGLDTRFGYGRINVGNAVLALLGAPPPPPPPPGNQAPTADFTHSCTVLNCSFTDGSTDSDGTVASWSWNFGDGSSSTERNPAHAYATEGSYNVTLTVTDDEGATGTKSSTVSVVSTPALIVADFDVSCTNLTCQFTNHSRHRDGVNLLSNWDMGDGSPMRLEWSPTHTYAQAGTYVVIMVVLAEDVSGWSSMRDTITVTAGAPPTGPTAGFTYSCTYLACTFTDASTAGSGAITTRSWNFGDGTPAGSGTSVSHTFAAPGTFSVTLNVTDANNLSDGDTQSITVQAAPTPPTAGFTYDCTFLACTFTDASTAGGAAISTRSWDFGDGTPAGSGTSISHTYAAGGTFSVTLTVTDANNLSDGETKSVAVAPPVPPTAGFTVSCTFLSCTFTDATTAGSSASLTRSWTLGDGTTSSATNPQHTYALGGTYSVALTVTDGNGLTDTETQSVTVDPPVISLDARGYKVRGRNTVDLTWSGATSARVVLIGNGAVLAVLDNSTTGPNIWTHATNKSGAATWTYRVCQADAAGNATSICSANVQVAF